MLSGRGGDYWSLEGPELIQAPKRTRIMGMMIEQRMLHMSLLYKVNRLAVLAVQVRVQVDPMMRFSSSIKSSSLSSESDSEELYW